MAFWGIEVKPGKPYTHSYDSARGRLRISQATLGNGKSGTSDTVVQCNVGDKSPILLCSLISNQYRTCHLELEFEETEDVIFSVLGQNSVHLSGYYIGSYGCNHDGDETDSFGEDIAGSDTSGSYSRDGDEDKYDSDFINDDDLNMFPSPRHKSNVVIEEIIEDEKGSNGNANRRRLKKKQQMSDSDDADDSERQMLVKRNNSIVLESEDEDGFPLTFSRSKNVVRGSAVNSKSEIDDKATGTNDKKRKINDITQDGKSKSDEHPDSVPSETGGETSEKSKKKKTMKEKEGATVEPYQDQVDKEGHHSENGAKSEEANIESKSEGTDDNEGKSKKKKKKSKKGKTTEIGVDASAEKTEDEAVKDVNESANNDEMDQDSLVNGGEQEKLPKTMKEKEGATVEPYQDQVDKEGHHSENGVKSEEANIESKSEGTDNEGKSKKKKKKSKKGKTTEIGVDASAEKTEDEAVKDVNEAANNDEMDQDSLVNGGEEEKLPIKSEAADNSVSPSTKGTNEKQKKKNKKKKPKNDMVLGAGVSEAADVNQTDTEKSKNESKKKNKDVALAEETGNEIKTAGTKAGLNTWTYPNGLVIEDLAMGKPDGKKAIPGKKVSVIYIGKLKNGKIFDSNVGKRPFEFRLGVGQVIKGWDIGVKGMRVGDKRRLTIPPDYGYGPVKVGPIPQNSWLLFDVELINVQ